MKNWHLCSFLGISAGEIGPKLGLNSNDNGYLIGFDKVRIPRDQLLMKHSQVLDVIIKTRVVMGIYFVKFNNLLFNEGWNLCQAKK